MHNYCSYHSTTSVQVYHAVSRDQKPLRKQYLEAILPPFVGVLRRWRPVLAAIHELATADGLNPLIADDRALAADSLPIEVLCFTCVFKYIVGIEISIVMLLHTYFHLKEVLVITVLTVLYVLLHWVLLIPSLPCMFCIQSYNKVLSFFHSSL